jgi:peptidoglycan-associated lipoprotein
VAARPVAPESESESGPDLAAVPAPVRAPAVAPPELATTITFDTGQSLLDAGGRAALDALAARAARNPSWILSVEGHADARGDAEGNERLSQQRAEAVARRLRARGIPASRLQLGAFGATRPVTDDADPASLRRNRRAEIHIERGTP